MNSGRHPLIYSGRFGTLAGHGHEWLAEQAASGFKRHERRQVATEFLLKLCSYRRSTKKFETKLRITSGARALKLVETQKGERPMAGEHELQDKS